MKLVIGLDGQSSGEKALEFATQLAANMETCELIVVYVIEWSPFSFQTPEENEQRHKRREEELALARERVLDPAVKETQGSSAEVEGVVKHGDAADILNSVAKKRGAMQIVVGRVGARGLKDRLFGGVTGRLVAVSSVPVTIIP